jgi:hypothetical protein
VHGYGLNDRLSFPCKSGVFIFTASRPLHSIHFLFLPSAVFSFYGEHVTLFVGINRIHYMRLEWSGEIVYVIRFEVLTAVNIKLLGIDSQKLLYLPIRLHSVASQKTLSLILYGLIFEDEPW